MNQKRVALYARVASPDSENIGLEKQLTRLNEYAKANNLDVIKEYKEVCSSGESEMLDFIIVDANNGLYDSLLITSIDRLTRSSSVARMIIDGLERRGVKLIALDQQ